MNLRSRSTTPPVSHAKVSGKIDKDERKYDREDRMHGAIIRIHKLNTNDSQQTQYLIEVSKPGAKKPVRGKQAVKTKKAWFTYDKAVQTFGLDELNEHITLFYESQDDAAVVCRQRKITEFKTKRIPTWRDELRFLTDDEDSSGGNHRKKK